MPGAVIAIILLLAALAGFTPARAETWIVASEEAFPPYSFTRNGRRVGIDVEIVEAALKAIGVSAQHQPLPWSRVIYSIDHDLVDLAFQFVGTPERFSRWTMVPLNRMSQTVLALPKASSFDYTGIADLKGMTIGVVQGYRYDEAFDQATQFRRESAEDNLLNLKKLAAGRLDAVIGDLSTLHYLARENGLVDQIRYAGKPVVQVPRYVAFPQARAERARRFADGMKRITDDGTLAMILQVWRGN
jgi:polar amino acid transport system substrate-binding protein